MLNSDAAPGSHEWVPCVGDKFPTREAFESVMEKLAANFFFVVRFRRALSECVGGVRSLMPMRAGVDAFCNRSSWGRL